MVTFNKLGHISLYNKMIEMLSEPEFLLHTIFLEDWKIEAFCKLGIKEDIPKRGCYACEYSEEKFRESDYNDDEIMCNFCPFIMDMSNRYCLEGVYDALIVKAHTLAIEYRYEGHVNEKLKQEVIELLKRIRDWPIKDNVICN